MSSSAIIHVGAEVRFLHEVVPRAVCWCALVVACLGIAVPARASDAITVAVVEFEPLNTSQADASAVSEFVRTSLINLNAYVIVDKRNMDKVLAEQAFQQTGCTSQDCAVKLGKILNARKIVVGTYGLIGGMRYITARLVDIETGRSERSAKAKGFGMTDIDTVAEGIARDLSGVSVSQVPSIADAGSAQSSRVLLSPQASGGALLPSIAILMPEAQAVAASEAAWVSAYLRAELINTRRFRVSTREDMVHHQIGPCGGVECAVKAGRLLETKYSMCGVFGRPADPTASHSRHLSVSVIDVETGRVLYRGSSRIVKGGDFQRAARELVAELSTRLGG